MTNALVRKLESFGPLPKDDKTLIESMTGSVQPMKAHSDIIREGDKPENVNLIVSGFGYRYKGLRNGSRQIVAYLLPGDFCDLHVALLGEMDHSIAALTDLQLGKLSRDTVLKLLDRAAISRAMLMATLVDEATLREWLANQGQRSAEQRIAHFFCEWHRRLKAIGMATDGRCELPLTQQEIGDTMGLSVVHTNRSLQYLRDTGLITLRSKRLVIPDMAKLCAACDFRPNYLHLKSAVTAT